MQTLKDRRSSSVFLVTDVLRGVRYFVADKGSRYEIQVPGRAGYVRVAVPRDADVIDVADELIRKLDTAPQKTSASLHIHRRHGAPNDSRTKCQLRS